VLERLSEESAGRCSYVDSKKSFTYAHVAPFFVELCSFSISLL
jgi:hypothetical protein